VDLRRSKPTLCSSRSTFLDALRRVAAAPGLAEGRVVYPCAARRAGRLEHACCCWQCAQTLHPVAGQGLNLGLRDAFELARAIKAEPDALHSRSFAERFHNRRRLDRGGSILLTDGLVRVFSNAFPGLGWLRGCGLTALDCLPPAKRVFMGRMLFGA
jgi:2-polyprenyl-6-methoxyphenol hydroxylase-like FAD-dependent oxidoreductase